MAKLPKPKCIDCPVHQELVLVNKKADTLMNETRKIRHENESLKAGPVYQLYEQAKDKESHWHKKWQDSNAQVKVLRGELRQERANIRDLTKCTSNMERGLERREVELANLKNTISNMNQCQADLKSENKDLERTALSLEKIIREYMDLYGPLPHSFSVVVELQEKKANGVQQELEEQLQSDSSESDEFSAEMKEEDGSNAGLLSKEEKERLEKELEAKNAEVMKLKKQLNRNSGNSSVPTSAEGLKKTKKPANNRKSKGNKRGGQVGHPGHHLGLFPNPDQIIQLPPEARFLDSSRYQPTGNKSVKQLVEMQVKVYVTQYEADIYLDKKGCYPVNGAQFPKGLMNKVTYGSSVKAAGMFLHTVGNMSYAKVREFLKEVTDGTISISCSELQSLEKEFSQRTEADRMKIMEDMFQDPYMGIDCSPVRIDGHHEHVLTLVTENGVLYFLDKHKGEDLVWKTPLLRLKKSKKNRDPSEQAKKIIYKGVFIHDCEVEFFNYGLFHQLCVIHETRYLRGVAENEPDTLWADLLRELLHEAMGEAKDAEDAGKEEVDPEKRREILEKYDQYIALGEKEYDGMTETQLLYRDGPRVLSRLKANRDMLLFFMSNVSVPPTNNASERALRAVKMHGKQCGGYFSSQAVLYYLDSLGVLETIRRSGGNRYQKMASTLGPEVSRMKSGSVLA